MVTDLFLVDATPDAVQAHNCSRSNYLNIDKQMIESYDDKTERKQAGYASLAELSQPLDELHAAPDQRFPHFFQRPWQQQPYRDP